MKIYDCFTFYNEFELLELRLQQHWDIVDQFVIVESDHTFQNTPKPYLLKDNWDRFSKWHGKMRLVTIKSSQHKDPWINERVQREAILEGITDADPRDMIVIGDVDEVLRHETFARLKTGTAGIYGFRMPLFNFKLNYMLTTTGSVYCVWNSAVRRNLLDSPEEFRRMRHALNSFPLDYDDDTIAIVEHAGWHWTYFGNEDFARAKIQGFAHSETNKPEILNQLNIEESIQAGRGIIRTDTEHVFCPVVVDKYFPDIVKSTTHIIPATHSAWDFLPESANYAK